MADTNRTKWDTSASDIVRQVTDFNRLWEAIEARLLLDPSIPSWKRGDKIDPELHARYEFWAPIHEYLTDLYQLAQACLPHRSWMPVALYRRSAHTVPDFPFGPRDIPALWQRLPYIFAGRLGITAETLPAFLCALADPPKFGTRTNRYEAQTERLLSWVSTCGTSHIRMLDVACGVGSGTMDILLQIIEQTGITASAVGVTREPLEVWMAQHRILPHDADRQREIKAFPRDLPVVFLAGDVRALPVRGHFDLILCNGLIGGSAFCREENYLAFLRELDRLLAPGGRVAIACRFHEGTHANLELFMGLAGHRGWHVQGTTTDMILHR